MCLRGSLCVLFRPKPLPHNHPDRARQCFWWSAPMRYETQADILRMIALLCRHYAAASLSLNITVSTHSLLSLVARGVSQGRRAVVALV